MAKIKIGSTEFYYELHGSGKPLVLVSGYCSNHMHWLPILDKLAQSFQVLIFDNRGIGQTTDNNIALSAELMADDTMMLSDALGLKSPSIMGHSMGGTIVQSLALRYPDKISKIGILQSSAKWRQAMLYGLKSMLIQQKENISFDAQFSTLLSWVFGEEFLQNKAGVAALKDILLADEFPQSIANQTRQFKVLEDFNSLIHLSNITVPTLVTSGLQDIISLPYEAETLAKNIPGAKLVVVNCGHNMILELPEQTTEILLNFF